MGEESEEGEKGENDDSNGEAGRRGVEKNVRAGVQKGKTGGTLIPT